VVFLGDGNIELADTDWVSSDGRWFVEERKSLHWHQQISALRSSTN